MTLQSGTPFSVFAGDRRADQNGDPNSGPETADNWFDTSVFTQPLAAHGTAPRNSVRGPGLRTIDLSLFKAFRIAGRYGLELRLEGFNVPNTPQYGTSYQPVPGRTPIRQVSPAPA